MAALCAPLALGQAATKMGSGRGRSAPTTAAPAVPDRRAADRCRPMPTDSGRYADWTFFKALRSSPIVVPGDGARGRARTDRSQTADGWLTLSDGLLTDG